MKLSPNNWTIFLTFLITFTNGYNADLLDEYVHHVEIVNKQLNVREKRNVVVAAVDDITQWTHSQILDKNRLVVVRWQPRHQEILFRIEARTNGYVGIGFSPDGSMERADIVIGWVDDRTLKPVLMVSL